MASEMKQRNPLQLNEIDLADLPGIVFRGRRRIGVAVIVGVLLAIGYLHSATYTYTVSLKVSPVSQEVNRQGNAISAFLGVRGLDAGQNMFELFLEGIYSEFATGLLVNDAELMVAIFEDHWDEESKSWREPKGVIGSLAGFVGRMIGKPSDPWQVPSSKHLQEFLIDQIDIDRSLDSPLVTISIQIEDGELGRKILAMLHQAVDEDLRGRAIARSTDRIAYLSEQMAKVAVVEYREALASILKEEEQYLMMASGSTSFSADPFGAPEISRRPTRPNPSLVLLSSIVLALIVGSIWVLSREIRRGAAAH